MKNMNIEVEEKLCVPAQSLDGKLGKISQITCLYAANRDENGDVKFTELTEQTLEGEQEEIGLLVNHGSWYAIKTYGHSDFSRLKKAYSVDESKDLVGKLVISVFESSDRYLTGLIPLIPRVMD